MTVHIVKLCVGIDSIERLDQIQRERRAHLINLGQLGENIHRTRNRPRRAVEILNGGSIYWIIKGFIRAHQTILRLDELQDNSGKKHCGIVLNSALIRTELYARRPHQGWRYLEIKDAPPDLPEGMQTGHWESKNKDTPPPEMAAELRALGLL